MFWWESVRKGSIVCQFTGVFSLPFLDLAPGHFVLLASVKMESGFHSYWYVRNLKGRRDEKGKNVRSQ